MKQYSYKTAPKTQKAKVQHLYIETDRSTGLLPADVFEYTNIEILSVRLLNAIPPEITKLKKLRKISVAFWGGGALPDYINQLEYLEDLGIRVVSETLVLPDTLVDLKNLKYLTFYQCKLKKIPAVLLKMPQLVKLEMSANEFSSLDLPNQCYWPNLECLDLRTNACEAIPTWIYEHKSLKELFLPNNKIKELPTALTSLKNLEKLTFDNNEIELIKADFSQLTQLDLLNWFENPMGWLLPFVFKLDEKLLDFKLFWRTDSKQYVKDVLSMKKALIKAGLLEDKIVIETICILLSKNESAKKALSNALVLDCYQVSNTKIRAAVIAEISSRLEVFDSSVFKEGSEVLVLGTTIKKKADLKARLKDLGITLVGKPSKDTSHVILGKNIKKTAALLDNKLILLTETALNHYLDEVAPAYLLEAEAEEPGNTANLQAMLRTLSDDNVLIALELLKSGGVPKDLMTSLFFVHKFSKNAAIVRKSKNLLTLNASENLLAALKIRFNFKRNQLDFFSAKHYLEKVCSQTEINAIELLKYAFDHYSQTYPFPTLYTDVVSELPEKEQKEAAKEFWNGRVDNGYLFLQEGDGRIINHLFEMDIVEILEGRHYPVTMLTSHPGGAKMKRLKKLILDYKRTEISLPKDFGILENLEELDFTNATFYDRGWEELKNLKNLKKLTYKSDAAQIPTEIFDLKHLKTLILDGQNIELDLPIHLLQNLEGIQVLSSSLLGATAFIRALKALPNLTKVQLHSDLEALYLG
jgi:Leucine-rich repeat (LRR) protein